MKLFYDLGFLNMDRNKTYCFSLRQTLKWRILNLMDWVVCFIEDSPRSPVAHYPWLRRGFVLQSSNTERVPILFPCQVAFRVGAWLLLPAGGGGGTAGARRADARCRSLKFPPPRFCLGGSDLDKAAEGLRKQTRKHMCCGSSRKGPLGPRQGCGRVRGSLNNVQPSL